jgi:hypothetical protein
METQDSIGYAGQTIVFSFYARAGANYSGGAFTGRVLYGTGTDQRVTTFTGIQVTTSVSATLTTSWQRFQGTATINAAATEIGFDFAYAPSGTAGANDYVEFTGVQFELGSVATTFQRAGGTLQGELAACQRYYYKISNGSGSPLGLCVGETTNLPIAVAVYTWWPGHVCCHQSQTTPPPTTTSAPTIFGRIRPSICSRSGSVFREPFPLFGQPHSRTIFFPKKNFGGPEKKFRFFDFLRAAH